MAGPGTSADAIAAPEALLRIEGVVKRFGGFTALDGIDLVVRPGERLGLIGPNGSGKSTLVNCIAGTLRNDAGRIHFGGVDLSRTATYRRVRMGIARSFQIPRPFASMSVIDNLRVPLLYAANHRAGDVAGVMAMDSARAGEEGMAILAQVGLAAKADAMAGGLTQVDMRKLELARAMAARPRLLISDEAMAGLSTAEVDEILALLMGLKERGVAVIMIEHVMRAVMRFSDRIAVLVAGHKIADGDPQSVAANPEVVSAYLGQ